MPALTVHRGRLSRRRLARAPQIIGCTQLVPIAAARQVLDEASLWLGVALPSRFAAGLAYRAHITYAHSPSFRRALHRPGDAAREHLYVFLRHWLADRLYRDRPDLFARLLPGYAVGEPPPVASATPCSAALLSNDARALRAM